MEISDAKQFVHWFRHSSPYINAHRGRTFVIHIGGEVVARDDFSHLVHDLALLNSLGVKLVLVHGAQPQIDARLAETGTQTQRINGLRITDSVLLPRIQESVALVRMAIESQLSMGLANSPMAGARIRVVGGNMVTAKPLGVVDGVDFQHTGEVRRIDTAAIEKHLNDGSIVLLSPIGYSPSGEIFSLGADDVATAAAIQLRADKLMSFIDSENLTDADGEPVELMTLSQAEDRLANMNADDELFYCFRHAVRACQMGVRRVHFINQNQSGALLLELFSRDGAGTLITSDHYDQVRQATIDDVGGLLELIAPLERQGILVRRSRERLEMEINHFTVMERDGMIIACAAIYPYAVDNTAELACLAVHEEYRKEGRGDTLLDYVEQKIQAMGIGQLFVLTSRTAHWFVERGFVEQDISSLPMARQGLYNYQRRSKVFVKTLNGGRKIKK
ncbi:MAG: amino-acid N-acetyltransferase [Gammaproteobacteria bacterium]|nr:amino-acid N-acetyltransferase [Gammaproteobacteria bacterium]